MQHAFVTTFFFALIAGLSPQSALAQTWAVSARGGDGVNPQDVSGFRRLLADELNTRGKQAVVVEPECSTWTCLQSAAAATQAQTAVDGELFRLGKKLIVRASARDVASGQTTGTARLTASTVEELETIAVRLAEALVTGKRVDETAEVGQAVRAEDDLGRLRGGRSGFAIWALGIVPRYDTYGDASPGVGIDLAYWFETRRFALEPRIGVHVDGNGGGDRFVEVPIEFGANWVPLAGDVSPFLGIAGGIRHMWEQRRVDVLLGSTLVSTSQVQLVDSVWGFGGTARAGVMLFRTFRLRLLLSGEYSITLVRLNGRRNPQAFRFGAGLLF